jgi:hypothetical protein
MHSQSNLKSPQTLATANILTHFIISMAVLWNVPLTRRRVTEKSHFFHTKPRSGRYRESNPGHLLGNWQAVSLDAQPSTTPRKSIYGTAADNNDVFTPPLELFFSILFEI